MITIGVFETVLIADQKFLAKIDTGAFSSSIDYEFVKSLGLSIFDDGKKHIYKSSFGKQERQRVQIEVYFGKLKRNIIFSVADRSMLNFSILIGRRDLKGFNIVVRPEEADPENSLNVRKL